MKTTVKIVMLLIIVMVTGSCTINGFGKYPGVGPYGKVTRKSYFVFPVIGEDKNSESYAYDDAIDQAYKRLSKNIKASLKDAALEVEYSEGKEKNSIMIDILERNIQVSIEGLKVMNKYPKAFFKRKCNCWKIRLAMGITTAKYNKAIRSAASNTIDISKKELGLTEKQYTVLKDDFVARALELGRKNQEEIY